MEANGEDSSVEVEVEKEDSAGEEDSLVVEREASEVEEDSLVVGREDSEVEEDSLVAGRVDSAVDLEAKVVDSHLVDSAEAVDSEEKEVSMDNSFFYLNKSSSLLYLNESKDQNCDTFKL